MAFVTFMMVKMMNTLAHKVKKDEDAQEPPKKKTCPYCKTKINNEATRCPNCTSELDKTSDSDLPEHNSFEIYVQNWS